MKTRVPFVLFACAVILVATGFSRRVCAAAAPSGITIAWAPEKAASTNAAIMAYLGAPVPPPADLDTKYTAEGLITAWKTVCAKLGVEVQKLAVDDTEFPFLLSGIIKGTHDLQAMTKELRAIPGYAYGGSVSGRANGQTFFSLNLIPSGQYPREQRQAIQRRLMIRLQMLGATWTEEPQ